MKPAAIQLYSLRHKAQQDLPGVLREVAQMGYKGVEFVDLYGNDPREVRKVLDDAGLVACSSHVPQTPNKDNLQQMVDVAKTLGYDKIVGGKWTDSWDTIDRIGMVAEEFQEGAELLKPHGLRLGYHNHWFEMYTQEGKRGLEILLARAPDIFAELDIYWASNFGDVDVPAFVRQYRSRIVLLHAKDGPLLFGQPHTALGQGRMDIPACVAQADPQVLEWIIAELDECATDMTQAVRDSFTYLTQNKLAEGRK